MTTHHDGTFMTVKEQDGILSLVFKEQTATLTDELFKTCAFTFISIVRATRSKCILVDMRNFKYILSEDIIEWRKKHIVRVYNELKVRKFAFISEQPVVNQEDSTNSFITKHFSNIDKALAWLSATDY